MKKTFRHIFVTSKLCIVLVAVVGVGSVGAVNGCLEIDNEIDSKVMVSDFAVQHYDPSSNGLDTFDIPTLYPPSGDYSAMYSEIFGYQFTTDTRPTDSNLPFDIKLVYNGTISVDTENHLEFFLSWGPEWDFDTKPILFQSDLLPFGSVVDVRKAIAKNGGVVPLIDLPTGSYSNGTPYGEATLYIGTRLLADLDDSKTINYIDFVLLANDWQQSGSGLVGDITGASGIPDGFVDIWDLLELVNSWMDSVP